MGNVMTNSSVNTTSNSTVRNQVERGPVVSGLWLRVTFIGLSAFAVGLIQLFDGSVKPLSALALAVVGAAMAVFSTRLARRALDVDEGAARAVKAATVLPANAFAG